MHRNLNAHAHVPHTRICLRLIGYHCDSLSCYRCADPVHELLCHLQQFLATGGEIDIPQLLDEVALCARHANDRLGSKLSSTAGPAEGPRKPRLTGPPKVNRCEYWSYSHICVYAPISHIHLAVLMHMHSYNPNRRERCTGEGLAPQAKTRPQKKCRFCLGMHTAAGCEKKRGYGVLLADEEEWRDRSSKETKENTPALLCPPLSTSTVFNGIPHKEAGEFKLQHLVVHEYVVSLLNI